MKAFMGESARANWIKMELQKITGVANDSVAHELHNICHYSAESSALLYKNSLGFWETTFLLHTEPQMPLNTCK